MTLIFKLLVLLYNHNYGKIYNYVYSAEGEVSSHPSLTEMPIYFHNSP